jgi:hypothetical protein
MKNDTKPIPVSILHAAWFCDMSAESRRQKAEKQKAEKQKAESRKAESRKQESRKQETVGRWRYKPPCGSYLRSAFCFLSRKFIPSKVYIRPICLIQMERTGKDQRDAQYIHAEDAKEFMIKKCNVPETHIAMKSAEKNDIQRI